MANADFNWMGEGGGGRGGWWVCMIRLSYETVWRWHKVRQECSIKSGRPVTETGNANVPKVRQIFKSDGRYTIRDIAKAVGMSLAGCISFWSVYCNYERFLPDWYRNIDRWPKTKNQKTRMWEQFATQWLKMFPKFNQRYVIIVTGDKTWVHYFELVS